MTSSVPQPDARPGDPASLPREHTLTLADAQATTRAGERLARALHGGMVITLAGDLGTGKTTLVRGALRGLGWHGSVKSPTYTLVEHYLVSSLYFYHFDFYRLRDPDEWSTTGFEEYFRPDAVCVVEWPDRAGGHLPPADLDIVLEYVGAGADAGRRMTLVARTEAGAECVRAMDRE